MNIYTNKTEIISLSDKFPETGYEVVKTFEELNGKNWLQYNEEQSLFYEANPGASPEEVYNMALNIYTPSLDELKSQILTEIDQADRSASVFYITMGETTIPMWLEEQRRANLLTLNIQTARVLGKDTVSLTMDTEPYLTFEFPVNILEQMLYSLQNYATDVYVHTNRLKASVYNAETEDALSMIELDGYPEPLKFDI